LLSIEITEDDLRIVIHHIGGIGGYGPAAVLDRLEHVSWVVYDAQESSLSTADGLESGRVTLVNRCIGGTDSRVPFHVTAMPSASSMLEPAEAAAGYTVMLPDGSARVWGAHTRITQSVEVDVTTLDTLAARGEVPPADFLSVDAQGAELEILRGASGMLRGDLAGVVCEVEFAHLYEGQGLFHETQQLLHEHQFRLCDLFSPQYLNTMPLPQELQGKGFLTVSEALFLKRGEYWTEGAVVQSSPAAATRAVVRTLKLAAIAVAFDQLDYAIKLCRRLEERQLVAVAQLASRVDVKYVRLLRDLLRAADEVQSRSGALPLETKDAALRDGAGGRRTLANLLSLMGFIVPRAVGRLARTVLNLSHRIDVPPVGAVLHEYGLRELAVRHAMRSSKYRRLKHLYNSAWDRLVG
jgi:FkbM family methyltransferase